MKGELPATVSAATDTGLSTCNWRNEQATPDLALSFAAPTAHEPCNVDRCRDDAEAVANDLAGNEKGIHGRPPPHRRILVGLSSGRCPRAPTGGEPRLRPIVGSKPGSAVKTRGGTGNRPSNPIFFCLRAIPRRRLVGQGDAPADTGPGPEDPAGAGARRTSRSLATSSRAAGTAEGWAAPGKRTPGDSRRPRTLVKMTSQHACRSRGVDRHVGSDTKAHNQCCQPPRHIVFLRACIRPRAQSYC